MKYEFPKGFKWGTTSCGPQSEGGKNKAGRHIFDYWYQKEPWRFHEECPPCGCNKYTFFKEDSRLMKKLRHTSFITSIQWSRLIKDYWKVEPDEDAVRFYNEYIDSLIEQGIEPILFLMAFDMPYELQEIGGWENKEVVSLFEKYAAVCFTLFGDRVKTWFTFCEPIVVSELGYLFDGAYPNKVDFKAALNVAYHLNVANARCIQAYREMKQDGEIGIILNITSTYPRSAHSEDIKAAEICDLIYNRTFLDPCIKGAFSKEWIDFVEEQHCVPDYREEELDIIRNNTIDILGVNYFFPRRVKAKENMVNPKAPITPNTFFDDYEMPSRRVNPYRGWEIFPKGIYDIALRLKKDYGNIKWMITENGTGVADEKRFKNEEGRIEDDYRIAFIKDHLIWLHRALQEGANCHGYFLWTFVDNWGWLNAFKNRYGFVELELFTQKRIVKKSGYWFKKLIEENGFEGDEDTWLQ